MPDDIAEIVRGRCEVCAHWNAAGQRYFGNRHLYGVQIWAFPCQRYPKFEPHWFDDWCGEFRAALQEDRPC